MKAKEKRKNENHFVVRILGPNNIGERNPEQKRIKKDEKRE